MKTLAMSAVLALAFGSAALAGGGSTPPEPDGSHRYVAPPGQDLDEGIVGFVDLATLSRSGPIAEADGILVPFQGINPFPNYISAHMTVNCSNRMAAVTQTRITNLAGADVGAIDATVPPDTLDENDEGTFALFCRPAGGGVQSFDTAQAAVAFARQVRRPDGAGEPEGGGK